MPQDFQTFRDTALARGFKEALVRRWDKDTVVPSHSHPFDAHALVVEGEMWLTVDGQTRHLGPGDTFEVPAGREHAERYGPRGAVYWVARR